MTRHQHVLVTNQTANGNNDVPRRSPSTTGAFPFNSWKAPSTNGLGNRGSPKHPKYDTVVTDSAWNAWRESVRIKSRMCDLLADTYYVPSGTPGVSHGVIPAPSCGQCSTCRPARHEEGTPPVPASVFHDNTGLEWSPWCRRVAMDGDVIHIFYRPTGRPADLDEWDDWLATRVRQWSTWDSRPLSRRVGSFRCPSSLHSINGHHAGSSSPMTSPLFRQTLCPLFPRSYCRILIPSNRFRSGFGITHRPNARMLVVPADIRDPEAPTELATRRRFPQLTMDGLMRS